MQGTPDTLEGVSAVARKVGINQNAINDIYQKYGNTMQARALCSFLGTTPEALKNDAEKIVGGSQTGPVTPTPKSSTRFPRLK